MAQLTEIQKMMLQKVADMKKMPEEGAFNLRLNGKGFVRHSSEHIEIVPKEDKPGIDIYIKAGTQGETVSIPVVITESGMDDLLAAASITAAVRIAVTMAFIRSTWARMPRCAILKNTMAQATAPAEKF